jgi:CelD/BcsL family acetyltransferase involved in cellulose biosynthesis
VGYRCIEDGEAGRLVDTFLKLFTLSREEKAGFMAPRMESFFRSLAGSMAEVGLLRFGILELDALPAAMIMGFDYNDSMYLYNSAYDPDYSHLSVGLLSKVLCIEESIQEGRKRFDFLKGGEPYKYRLGGNEIPLYSCQVALS